MSFKTSNYKDRELYRRVNREYKRRYRQKNGAHKYARRLWTQDEETLVVLSEIPDSVLAKMMGRSVGAIQKHRWKLRKKGHSIDNKAGIIRTSPEP